MKIPRWQSERKAGGGFFICGMVTKQLQIMRCATNEPKIGAQRVKSTRKQHKGNSSLVDVQGGPNKNNPNLFPIGDGFGLFVFFGKFNMGVRGR
jgi:hypothetical protein